MCVSERERANKKKVQFVDVVSAPMFCSDTSKTMSTNTPPLNECKWDEGWEIRVVYVIRHLLLFKSI